MLPLLQTDGVHTQAGALPVALHVACGPHAVDVCHAVQPLGWRVHVWTASFADEHRVAFAEHWSEQLTPELELLPLELPLPLALLPLLLLVLPLALLLELALLLPLDPLPLLATSPPASAPPELLDPLLPLPEPPPSEGTPAPSEPPSPDASECASMPKTWSHCALAKHNAPRTATRASLRIYHEPLT